jgi:CheY-like chemotaxis protein
MVQQKVDPSLPNNDVTPSAPRVLVVEDHDDTRRMLRTILEMENFSVLEAVDGADAFRLALKERPDIILMDLTLPVIDGVTATREIRKQRTIGKTPIIFLSGRAEPAGRQAAFAAGCDEFVVKPINIDDVLSLIRRWLLQRDGHTEVH